MPTISDVKKKKPFVFMNTIYYATSTPTILDVKKMHFVFMITIYYAHGHGREKVQPSTITC